MQTGEIIELRYQLIRQLQTAWLALDRASGQTCLLKPQSSYFDPRTATWLGQVRHAGLPRLLGVLPVPDGETYFIFEYLDGRSFRELADEQHGRIPLEQLLTLALQAARILAFLHLQDDGPILHLDIKPENLILTDQGQVCLIDFGAAQWVRPSQSVSFHEMMLSPGVAGQVALTPEYAAPELLSGHPGTGSDLFALGLTLLHLLTGLPPSVCRSQPLPELLSAIPVMTAMTAETVIPGVMNRLIGRCLHTDLDIRLCSAAELVSELTTQQSLLQNGLIINDEPDSAPTRLAEPQSDNPSAPLICVWDGAELGCELAAVLAEQNQVLVIDADLLNPQADLLLGMDNNSRSKPQKNNLDGLDLVLSEEQRGHLDVTTLNQLAQTCRISQVRALTTRSGLEHYDYLNLDSLNQVLNISRLVCDLVIVLCSRFVYDAFTCLCLQAADLILIPLAGDSNSFRRCNRAVEFLRVRQQLNLNKIRYVAIPYHRQTDLSWGTMDELCGGRLVGCISDRDNRRSMKSGATPYAAALDRSCRQEYQALIRRVNLPVIRKAIRKKVNA